MKLELLTANMQRLTTQRMSRQMAHCLIQILRILQVNYTTGKLQYTAGKLTISHVLHLFVY